ncbi:MAG: MATE family efflux transporter [Oscillochloridaceae bacterium]|nr:MATE family efflux transporter [Chloroflexaceae bacterium]MDW8388749.1 MATE family efflux transporter [Oscillochloridaceae bacterium]
MRAVSAPDSARSQPGGSIRRRMFVLALPAVGEQLLNTMVGLADVFLVGNLAPATAALLGYDSAAALTAVGLGNQFSWIVMVLFMAVGIGATALVARAVGARDETSLGRIVRQVALLGVLVGVTATALGLLAAEPFLATLNAPQETRAIGVEYIHITALTFLPTALLIAITACLRGAGDTRTPLLLMLAVNTINIAVTWLLVNGQLGMPALGVTGAALGAALARGLGGIAAVVLMLRGHAGLRLVLEWRPDPEMLRRLVRVGLPTAGEQFVFQAALLIFVRFVTNLGATAYAAHNITITIESVSFLPGMGYAAATGALVGQALGARRPDEAERSAYEGLFQGGLMMSALGVLMALFPAQLVSLFTNDPMVVAAATPPLRAAGLVQPALAVSFILLGALRGAGDTRWPLYSRLFTTWVVRLPLTFVVVGQLGGGLPGVWLAMCTDFTLQAIMALWRFSSGKWQKIEV